MFQGVTVDGSSSCFPGQQAYDVVGDDTVEVSGAAAWSPAGSDADVFGNNPVSSSSHKRASSTTNTASSPSKAKKVLVTYIMQGLVTQYRVEMPD